ncbi:hypothetical protein V1527DRAFT_61580 [Lipomyces starkeyi]
MIVPREKGLQLQNSLSNCGTKATYTELMWLWAISRVCSFVNGSHGAMKGALTSSSGTLYAAAKKINHSGIERSQQLSVISSNENMFVRLDIRNQVETALLCTAIS